MPKKEEQGNGQNPEKIVTKYDLKMQRRKEQKEKERREAQVSRIVGIVLAAALVCIIASFPIRNYLTVNGTYVSVNGEDISRVEFDYNYYVARNNYLTQYGGYLSYFGVDTSRDITNQMYSDTLTWGDYFQELAVGNIARNKELVKQAREEGFSYDLEEEYRKFAEAFETAASEAGSTAKAYVKELYGAYATQSRIKPYVEEGLLASAYAETLGERFTPGQEEIQAYYEENKASYDSVDYYMEIVDAQLPTEPTELADPVEETEDEEASGDEASGDEAEAEYQPSEAEIAAAMELAKEEADKKEKTVSADNDLNENVRRAAVNSLIRDWLFDEERKAGDTTVVEDSANHRYLVAGFEKRYLSEAPSADIRVAITAEDNGQAILDEWKNGAATEESFAELCDKYNDPEITSLQGGLVEAALESNVPPELTSWIQEERKAGDTTVVSPEGDGFTYVVYYIGQNDPQWILEIRDSLMQERMSDYLKEIVDTADVQDPKNNLKYLHVPEPEESSEAGSGEDSSAESSEAESGEDGPAESSEAESGEDGSAESSEAESETDGSDEGSGEE